MSRKLLWALLLGSLTSVYSDLPIDLSNRLSESVQNRIQSYLDRTLGKDKSAVFVNIELDFPEKLKQELARNLQESLETKKQRPLAAQATEIKKASPPSPAPKPDWLSSTIATMKESGDRPTTSYAFPGYAILEYLSQPKEEPPKKEEKEEMPTPMASPQVADEPKAPPIDPAILFSLGLKVKKAFIRILLDPSVPDWKKPIVEDIVKAAFPLDLSRGDELVVAKVQLIEPIPEKNIIKEFLKDLGFWNLVIKFLALMGVMLVLWRIGSTFQHALSRRSEVSFQAPSNIELSHNVRALPMAGQATVEAIPGDTRPQIADQASRDGTTTRIDIPKNRIGDLCEMLSKETPQRVALVATLLNLEMRVEFLGFFKDRNLPAILSHMATAQFVEPEMLATLKDELEHRLKGLVGSEEDLLATLDHSDSQTKKDLLGSLRIENEELYKRMRSKIVLFEDLENIKETDLAKLVGQVPMDELAKALRPGDQAEDFAALRAKILKCLPTKTANTVREMLELGTPVSKQEISAAQNHLAFIAEKMLREGILTLSSEA